MSNIFHNCCNITDRMYKGVGGRMGGGWVVGVGGQPKVGYSFQQDCLEVPRVQAVLVISLDEPGWPTRRVTIIGMNIRPMPPIWCPPWPIVQSWLHMVGKPALEKQTSQLILSMQQCTGSVWVLSAGPITRNRPSVIIWSVFQYTVTYYISMVMASHQTFLVKLIYHLVHYPTKDLRRRL